MTDLQSCYSRQLAEIVLILEESIRIERKPIQLIAKVLLVMEYYVHTNYGISTQFCSRIHEKQAGTGQGNIRSRNIYRDLLGINIK